MPRRPPRNGALLALGLCVGCTTSFDLSTLPRRDVAPAPVDAPPGEDTPTVADAPVETDVPAPSDLPAPTDAPPPTDLPAPTDAPPPTDLPAPNDTPSARDVPSPLDVRDVPAPQDVVTCSAACTRPHAVSSCEAGRCVIRSCHDGFADCDADPANGCEADILNDPNRCGGCGLACPVVGPADHILRVCTQGRCERRCEGRYFDCDTNPDCEREVTTSVCTVCMSGDRRCAESAVPGRERYCCVFVRPTNTCCWR